MEPVKSECEESGGAERGLIQEGGPEAAVEAVPEGALKAEKKEASGSGAKGPAPRAQAPQDSDSSATCSAADEVDEPEGGDKNR